MDKSNTTAQQSKDFFIENNPKEQDTDIRSIFDNLDDGILLLDDGNRIVFANPAAERLFGYPPEELMGTEFGFPIKGNVPPEIALPFRKKGPGTGLMNIAKIVLRGRACTLVSIRDITKLKKTQKALQKSEHLLGIKNRIAEIFLTSPEDKVYGEVIEVVMKETQSDLGTLGYIDEEGNNIIGTFTEDIWHRCKLEDKKPIFPLKNVGGIWKKVYKEGKTQFSKGPFTIPKGHFVIEQILVVPIVYRKQVIGYLALANKPGEYTDEDIALVEDIASWMAPIIQARRELARKEKERQNLEKQLFHTSKMEAIGRLAGGVAHDFNNILSIILGYGETILNYIHPQDPLWQYVEQIIEAAKRGATLTRQLLTFSHKQKLQPEVLNINDIIKNLEKMLRRLVGEDIDFKLYLSDNIYPVLVDPGQIEQVILNLVINSRDAMPKGGRLIIETANAELDKEYAKKHVNVKPGKYVRIVVTDTGCGMDKETMSKIFDPFFTTKGKEKGTGLGLSIVYGIVKQSGGYIWVYSEPGQGTTFKIYLPKTDVRAKKEGEEEKPQTALRPSGGEHILVVEDEDILRELFYAMLSQLGYKVSVAANGGEALLLIEKKGLKPDIIITDIIMPHMSGKELVERLKEKLPHLKVIYMSGYPEEEITYRGVSDENIPFIQKPFSIHEIAEKIQRVLGKENK